MIIEGVDARGLLHCETTALGVLLRQQGLELSEPMMFGLGAGLGFVYWDAKGMDLPFLGGRVRPFELTRNLAGRLGLDLEVRETTSRRKAWQNVTDHIDAGRAVGLQLDSHHLDYFTSKEHFGGHIVAMYGYDDDAARLVDTGQQGGAVTTGLAALAAARAERGPMTARNRSFTLTVPERVPAPRDVVVPAIKACAAGFLDPPIANLGHRGIEKTARQIGRWWGRSADPARDLPRAALLMEHAGTGGALFRNLYRDFLGECAELRDDAALRTGHEMYGRAAAMWTGVAGLIAKAGESGDPAPLDQAATLLHDLSRLEHDAMRALATIETPSAPGP
ncbi:BtrH N-terminal domain-containing protein [Sphaerisporangium corydalis]|uniref:BtrH N-terminal domain-containing protein n=1 Tax=Sphaerisporangium corydalis TaxID=1441875 RepID=A0ABV9EFL7_9ACTN|nr:BtrH N-terminal domain-containing protein [Sphaerisporangium corydalis]